MSRANLRPMHRSCNSQKNGTKGTDSAAPQRRGKCPALKPGGACNVMKVATSGKAPGIPDSKEEEIASGGEMDMESDNDEGEEEGEE